MQHKNAQPVGTEILDGIDGSNLKIGIVVSTFHGEITSALEKGAIDACLRHSISEDSIRVVHVRGAFELPLAAQRLAREKYDGIVAVGCVIRGATSHYDIVCGESIRGLMDVMLTESVPVGLGIATVDTMEQAKDRAGGTENLGENAALAVLDLIASK